MRFDVWLRDLQRLTRPVHEDTATALDARWRGLPEHVRMQPGLNPCYRSRNANRVAVSGSHTQREVRAQMGLLRRVRGPRAHAQLIGGEVSLLPPDDHAATLQIMREHGREPSVSSWRTILTVTGAAGRGRAVQSDDVRLLRR